MRKTLTNSTVLHRVRTTAIFSLLILFAQTTLGQSNPDIPDFAPRKANKEEFMIRRAEAIGFKRGIEKDKPFDPTLRISAIQQMEMQKAQSRQNNKTEAAWTELGPNPIPNGQVVSGSSLAVSGRTVSIAVHPTDPNTVYVGTAQGGLYRSLDGGATWVSLMDNALSLAINAVAIAPSQPTTIFVGTGEAGFSADSYFGVGIYRIDNANSGSPIITGPIGGALFTGRSVSKIVVHPTDPNIIFAATASGIGGIGGASNPILASRGIFRSTNALSGAPAFTKLTITGVAGQDRPFVDMVMDPGNPDLVLCTEYDSFGLGEGGVYRSTNALAAVPVFTRTFTAGTGTSLSRTELALHRSGGGVVTVYAASAFDGGTVQRSIDGGATWTQRIDNNFCGGQCFYNIAIAVDPTNADRVYLGGTGTTTTFGISTNGGTTFTNSQNGLHTDTHVITVAPSSPSTVYFGSDGGIYKSTNSGATWASLNNTTFKATQFMSLAVHPVDPNFTIGGTQDNGTNFYQPAGTWTRADYGDGGYSLIDQGATNNVNVDMYHTYFNTTNAPALIGYATVSTTASAVDGGWTFRGCNTVTGNGIPCNGAVLFYAPIEQGPGTPNTIYFGANILYRSANKGVNHTAVSQNLTNPISAIGISPQNDNVRIVGQNNGGIFGTTTGSSTLTNLDAGGTIPNNFIARAVIDPNNVNTAYVTLSAFGVVNIWKTTNLNNATPTWTAAATGIPLVPVNAFVVDPANSNSLYAGTDIGVYESTDAGATWLPYGSGLPVVAVFDMAIQPVSRMLRIATHGRGLWENPLPAAPCTITCPANITVPNTLNQCSAVVNFAAPTTIGTCGLVTVTPASGSVFPVGTTTVTATSAAGPTCSFTVTVQDTQAPTLGACPANITVPNTLNQCSAIVTFTLPTATDNCPGVTVTSFPVSGSVFPVGTTTVTVTASDSSPNSPDATCTFTVTVQDTQAPALGVCPANISVPNTLNQCGAIVTFTLPVGTDNCPGVTVTASPASGSFFPVGTTTVTVTAADLSANSPNTTCTFTVTVQDTQAPALGACPANITVPNTLNQCGAVVTFTLPTATDNCPGVTATASPASGSFFPVGTTTVTVTASDGSAGSPDATCTFTVTVQDTQAPALGACPANIIIANDANQCGALVSFTLPSATDNCAGVTVSASHASGSFFPVGTTTVTVTAADTSPNSPNSTCTFTVTVQDTQAPALGACPANITLPNNLNQCGAVVNFSLPSATDNCPGVTVTANPASGSFFPVGTTTVTVTASDGSVSSTDPTCTFTVTIQDTQAPALGACPANITVPNDLNQCGAVVTFTLPTASDNCPGVTVTASPASGSFFPVGTTTVTVTAADLSPNSSNTTCTFTVTVQDTQAPALGACPANITVSNDLNQCGAVVAFSLPSAIDNCGGITVTATPVSGSFFPVGTTTVTVTASDGSANSPDATCTFTVTVQDTQAPALGACPANVTVPNNLNQCGAVVTFILPSGTDNCGSVTVIASPVSGSFFPVGTTTVTVTGSDGSVNSPDATCTFTVTVMDTQAPTIICPGNISATTAFPNGVAGCRATVALPLPATTENCTPVIQWFITGATPSSSGLGTLSSFIFNIGVSQVQYIITDGAGNSASCSFNVTVTNPTTGAITGTATVPQNIATTSPVTFTGSSGTPNYTFTYDVSVNGGPFGSVQTISTTSGQSTVTVSQSNAITGSYQYRLLSVTDASGCTGVLTAPVTATITVVVVAGAPDLTSSQFFTTIQIPPGGVIDEVIAIRNVGTGPTTGPVVFSITNYSALSGLTVSLNGASTVTIGIDTYTLDNTNWIFNPGLGTFTSNLPIPAGQSRNIGIRFTRGVSPSQGANGSVTQTTTVSAGTGGGETPGTNNSISNSILKN